MRSAFGQQFDLSDGYLNTASIGVPPVPVAEAVTDAVADWRRGAAQPPDYDPAVATGRAAFAGLVGVPVERVAMAGSASALIGLIAAAVPEGTRVLVAAGDFTSVSFPFAAQGRRGVTVVEQPLEALGDRAPEFDLVAVSVVQSADGRLVDLDALRVARESGTRVVLDASQALGWLPVRLDWADAVVCVGYKWLLCPRGVAWMAVRPELDLVASYANWYAGDDPWRTVYGLPLRLAGSARGFDMSPVWFSHVGAAAALPWLAGLDGEAVRAHCAGLADAVRAGLGTQPTGSAIVAVRRPEAAERLSAAGVVGSLRAGAARLSFHLYNTADDVDRVLDALT